MAWEKMKRESKERARARADGKYIADHPEWRDAIEDYFFGVLDHNEIEMLADEEGVTPKYMRLMLNYACEFQSGIHDHEQHNYP